MTRPAALTTCSALAVAGVLAVSGCSTDGTVSRVVPKANVETKARAVMKAQTKKDYPVTCPGDLPLKTGATIKCVWTGTDGSTLGLTVTALNEDANSAKLKVQADGSATKS